MGVLVPDPGTHVVVVVPCVVWEQWVDGCRSELAEVVSGSERCARKQMPEAVVAAMFRGE